MFETAPNTPKRLRALWALHVTDWLRTDRLSELLYYYNEHVRAWTVQFLCDESGINAFQPRSETDTQPELRIAALTLQEFAVMSKEDSSQIVRLYLASAVQRLPFEKRWPILAGSNRVRQESC